MTVAPETPGWAANAAMPARAATACAPWITRYAPRPAGPSLHYRIAKRLLDITVGGVALMAALPVMALAVVALKLESPSAPAFFRQPRTGRSGKWFQLLKLRSMVPDAEAGKAALSTLNTRSWPDFKVENDPRVTRVGRILRRTSVDELPQLVNVLLGHMSLVGPRPISLDPARHERWQLERSDVKPGLTGLWQVAGRSSPSFVERVRLDIAYTERCTFCLDVELMLRTIPVILSGRGAS